MKEKYKSPLMVSLLLAVMVFAVYSNIFKNSATNWDDPALFRWETLHSMTVENLREVFTYRSGATFQPVRDLSYMIDFSLWGPQVVFGMHLQSLLLYMLMVIACYAFIRELLKVFHDNEEECYTWAAIASVLFAVHPVHVESVTWLYARKEPLLGLFTFLALWAFIKARMVSWKYYLLSVGALLLAILSKPTALVVPGVMFMLDIAMQARLKEPSFWKRRLAVYVPILIMVVPMLVRLINMMIYTGGVKPYHGGSFGTNLFAVSQILFSYITLIGFTLNYSADYPIPLYVDPKTVMPWVYLGLNGLLLMSGVWAFVKKRYVYSFFVAWYYILLLPVSHIFPISQNMTDRYALLPSLSWCMLLGYLLSRLWHLRSSRVSPHFAMALAIGLFGFVTLFYSYMTFQQNSIWRNSQTLWEDTLAKYPDSSPANVNLAAIYIHQGRYEEVQELCLRAIKYQPYDYLAISNLALAQMMMKQYDNAVNNYRQALRLKPDLWEAKMGLAYTYAEKGDHANAYALYKELLPGSSGAGGGFKAKGYYHLGYAAWKLGKKDEAYTYLALAEPGMRKDKFLLTDLAGLYTSMMDMKKAYELYSALYPMLGKNDPREKLGMLLKALEKKLRQQETRD